MAPALLYAGARAAAFVEISYRTDKYPAGSGLSSGRVLMGARVRYTPPRQAQSKEDAMAKLFPCLWFDGTAEEAAGFYVTLLADSHVDKVWRSPTKTPSGPAGMVLTVNFTLAGQQVQGLNGGPDCHVQRGGVVRHRLRRPGRGRSAVGRAHGERRRAWPVWLAQGPLRVVVADRAAPAERVAQ